MYIRRIKELRIDNDIKQKELALYLNIAENTYNQYENDKRHFPIEYIVKLALYYDVSIDYLLRTNKSKNAISSCEFWAKKISLTTIFYFVQC